ncbi:MAG: transcription-repair coupling factor [Clostridia bacterium]|nr:transcription-repair coupling factor [Clostridia bacterium]
MNILIDELQNSKKFSEVINHIKETKSPISLSGLSDMGKIQTIATLNNSLNKNICVITYNQIQAKRLLKDMTYFTSKAAIFPKKELVTYDYIAGSKELPYERIEVLNNIRSNKINIVILTIEALMQDMIEKNVLYKNSIKVKVGDTLNIDYLKQKLVNLGYERKDLIDGRGQFSIRGGIVDISISEKQGVRLEFWGDDIDSIRRFDIISQRSIEMIEHFEINPSHEYVLEYGLDKVIEQIERTNYENKQNIKEDLDIIRSGDYISKIDKYFNSFYSKRSNILEYLDNFVIVFDEFGKINQRIDNIKIENRNLVKTLLEKEKSVPDVINNLVEFQKSYKGLSDEIIANDFKIDESEHLPVNNSSVGIDLTNKQCIFIFKDDIVSSKISNTIISFNYRDMLFYKNEIDSLVTTLQDAIRKKKNILILGGSEENAKKIGILLSDRNIENTFTKKVDELSKGKVIISTGALTSGFEAYDLDLLVISSEDFFTSIPVKKKKVAKDFKEGEKVVFADLRIGDYVVHQTHGIGQYIGVNTIKADNVIKDYVKIRYKDDDILYVPTTNMDTIRKYVGSEGTPKIYKLGGKDWSKVKARVKNNLREVARELIELYAKREKIKGHAFSKDTDWQKQFEENFEYVETDDQLRCIEEVKKDMEQPKPMDRLLCGDVGYGKTEVAIRAAFKAVMDHKQVAYLVPTTVLANQQYEEFKRRMKEFAINVELLNRFRTKKEQSNTIKKLKLGEADVVVGTHRILSEDVEFRDLGLLIIDEEHRFGVKDKEKIKQLKNSVDVLTMTATPIPRTLHMSIVGVRDMSVIYEPPQARKPVQTYVLEYDKDVIKEAITKELERNGQVFYLYNNVENIAKKAMEISQLVPEAEVTFAHGQMTGKEIEEIMFDFINKKTNVLVCTTILESGIDIPNANTIIVENADRLGLAQLYQIRGRVGRSDKQAYAYITYKPDKLLSEVADKRLKAIKEFTEFGSGFKIAMRDLEIRGAGSLLGEIQHGHMEQVGYEMYCKLLDEVIKEMQGIEVQEEIDVQIDLNISSYIPDEYINDASQKIEIYQDIALCRSEEDIANIVDELIDRYGNIPSEVENLLEIVRIKELCRKANIIKLSKKNSGFVFYFDSSKFDFSVVDSLIKEYGNLVSFSPGKEPYITLRSKAVKVSEQFEEIKKFLRIRAE